MFKTANVGKADRLIRIVLGALIVALPFISSWSSPVARWGSFVIGVVLIATALVRFCPLYRVINTNTCGASRQ